MDGSGYLSMFMYSIDLGVKFLIFFDIFSIYFLFRKMLMFMCRVIFCRVLGSI